LIYLDSSVALAQLLAEDRLPAPGLWAESLVSSRLLAYEVWTRIHAYELGTTHSEEARGLLGKVSFLELAPMVLARALEPFPVAVRTLDALHLATLEYLRANGQAVRLATYDERMTTAARAMGVELFPA
jgi:predicted nucleic acid-binding protein